MLLVYCENSITLNSEGVKNVISLFYKGLILDFANYKKYPFIIKSTSVHGRKATYFDEANDGWTNFKWLSRLQHTIHMRWNNRTL